jgi:hypothetical protein
MQRSRFKMRQNWVFDGQKVPNIEEEIIYVF